MNDRMSRCVKQILAGTASVETAQACLAKLNPDDIKTLFPEGELEALMDRYKARNRYEAAPLIKLTHAQRSAGWQQILAAVQPRRNPVRQSRGWLRAHWIGLSERFTAAPSIRWGLSMALVLLILSPVWYHYEMSNDPSYLGEKGPYAEAPASFQYSLVNPDGKLLRPDRIITEADTLAFRVETVRWGFASIYIVQNHHFDVIFSGQQLSRGIHDLSVGYTLSGNKGINTLILLFSDDPVTMNVPQKQRLLIEAVHNGVTSMTIEGNAIYIVSQRIEVH
jgi:hypothetical protein